MKTKKEYHDIFKKVLKKVIKITAIIIAVMMALTLLYWVRSGFSRRTDVVLVECSVSEDGTQLNFIASVWSSIGYTRGFREIEKGNAHYLTFYGTFGGINSRWGAQNRFSLELDEDDTEIYVLTSAGYKLALQKNPETAEWERVLPNQE